MPKASYIQNNDDAFAAQLLLFKNNIGGYSATIGVSAAQVTAQAADAAYFAYCVQCQEAMQNAAQQWTSWRDLSLMAERLRQRGAVPKANRYVDLSARLEGDDFLFEMKSTTADNPHSQIRWGLSQLYEYRYIQNVKDAKLVLVIENPLSKQNRWMEDYLIKDRGVLLVWDGDGKFHCSPEIRHQLEFLS